MRHNQTAPHAKRTTCKSLRAERAYRGGRVVLEPFLTNEKDATNHDNKPDIFANRRICHYMTNRDIQVFETF